MKNTDNHQFQNHAGPENLYIPPLLSVTRQGICTLKRILGYINRTEKFAALLDMLSDITCFRGNELRPARGIVTRKLGQSTVEPTDPEDADVHRRTFSENPTKSRVDLK